MAAACPPALAAAGHVSEVRLWQRHLEMARFGATAKGGVNRQALSGEEIAARRQLVAWGREIGLTAYHDAAGNLFLRLDGTAPALAPVLTGSHLDSQPTGGRFDGIYGVLAGLEAVQAIVAAGVRPRRPIEVVAWMNEEGSRFAPGMMGSEVFAGLRPLDAVLAVTDAAGTSVAEALRDVLAAEAGTVAPRPAGPAPHAFLEAHIEQGPVLEAAGVPIGVVTGIQGVRRYRVRVTGTEAHAGTTPRAERRDALLAAVRIVDRLQAEADLPGVMFTVGLFEVKPNAPSVVPADAYFSIDLRHPDDALLRRLGERVAAVAAELAPPCTVEVQEIARADALRFPEDLCDRIAGAADRLGLKHLALPSLAGHDARQLHRICPTAMIFVPCKGGVSHREDEYASPADLAAGCRVLTECLLDLAETAHD
ncbi:M20 family metallo-hydrolase [Zavarzinia sp.]|uniref:M20 family metallo-hydrolase n=1 Tax=Zavarzinia sp. TaxID=2027920 RepID=UPI003568E512